jgi:dihydroorotase-like cyclic amidohydrolase
MDVEEEITARKMYTRAGWTPFEGRKVHGVVRQVTLRGEIVYQDGKVSAPPGFGRRIR